MTDSRSPLDILMDGVEFLAVAEPDDPDNTLPAVTHSGVLHIGELALPVYQLSNGQRMISQEAIDVLFGEGWEDEVKRLEAELRKKGNV